MTRNTGDRFSSTCIAVATIIVTLTCPLSIDGDGRALAQQGNGTQAVRVEVVKPARRTVVRELRMPATLVADERVELYAKVSGYVDRIDVDIGSRVQQGDVLATLSVPEMADELRQAEAILKAKQANVRALQAKAAHAQRMIDTARAEVARYAAQHELDQISLERQEELRKGNAIPQQALDESRSAHKIAEAQLAIGQTRVAGAEAEKQAVDAHVAAAESEVLVDRAKLARFKTLMEYAVIKAPFDGVITERHVDHGTFVRSAAEGTTMPLLRIAKTSRIRIVLEIPESDMRYVHAGTEVEVDVQALDEEPLAGAVARTAGALKPETRTMRTEVDLDNADGRLAPGMYAKVVVKLQSQAEALVIPSKAIRIQGKNVVVFVSASGVVQSKPVEVGYDDGIWAEILSGLDGEEMIIISTSGSVAPGVAVKPAPVASSET